MRIDRREIPLNITLPISFKSMIAEGKFGPAELHRHYLILNHSDTVYFAYELNTDSEYHFTGSNAKGQYHLRVKRLNQVLLQYEAMIIAANDTLYYHKGSAELVTGFFLAVELPEDEETEEPFPATEYTDSKNGMSIEVSITDANEPLKIIWSINNNTNTTFNGYSPTLKMISAATNQ